MRKYEILLVLPGTLDEKESEEKTNEVVSLVNKFSKDVVVTPMGKNRLAYPINHIRYGYFYTIIFSTEPENVDKIEKKIKIIRDLLRSIISHYNKSIEGAQKISNFNEAFRNNNNQNNTTQNLKQAESKPELPKTTSIKIETPDTKETKEKVEEEVKKETSDNKNDSKEKTVEISTKDSKKEEKEEKSSIDLKEIDKKLDEFLSDDAIKI